MSETPKMMTLEEIPLPALLAELERRRQEIGTALSRCTERYLPELRAVAEAWGLPVDELFAPIRDYTRSRARWTVFALLREQELKLTRIAEIFGMDHTTVLYGLRTLETENHSPHPTAAKVLKARALLAEMREQNRDHDL